MFGRDSSPFAPLPGTEPAPRGLFLDRWGTLFQLADGPCRDFDDVVVIDSALELLFRAQQERWNIYLIGNEDDVAHGRVSTEEWERLRERTHAHLEAWGVKVHRDYTCIDDPVAGSVGRRADSVYRLPNTGAFYHAAHNDGLHLSSSWVVGDSTLELVAGWRAGCRTLGLETGLGLSDATYHVDPDLMASGLTAGLQQVLSVAPRATV